MSFPYPPPPPTTCVRCGHALIGPYATTPAGPMHFPCSAAAFAPATAPPRKGLSGCAIAAVIAGGLFFALLLIFAAVMKTAVPEKPVSATCRELVDLYKDNEVAAEQRFDRKLVRLNACRVVQVEKTFGSVSVELVPAGGSLMRIRCGMKDEKSAASLNAGDPVEVTGRVLGETLGNISISDCGIR